MSRKQDVLSQLSALHIPFEHYEHETAHTIADCYTLPYYQQDITICKNILLCNRQQTAFYLYITLADKPFKTAQVSKLLGVSRLSFAPAELLPALFQLESGSLCPFALWLDEKNQITFVVDRDVMLTPRIAFHPADNTATIVFSQEIFWQNVVPALRHEPVLLDVPMLEE